jgi:hypothetical protein
VNGEWKNGEWVERRSGILPYLSTISPFTIHHSLDYFFLPSLRTIFSPA